jgi:hypothetical protein
MEIDCQQQLSPSKRIPDTPTEVRCDNEASNRIIEQVVGNSRTRQHMFNCNHRPYALAAVGCDNEASNRIIEQVGAIVALVSICPIVAIVRTHLLQLVVTIKPATELSDRSEPPSHPSAYIRLDPLSVRTN